MYSPEPRDDAFCFGLKFNVSKAIYLSDKKSVKLRFCLLILGNSSCKKGRPKWQLTNAESYHN